MRKVLVLGAGLVCRPLVRYLLDQGDLHLTVASRTVSKAEALIDGHPRGRALALLADDHAKLEQLVAEHDLAVSLLPAPLHPVIAEMCVKHRKHMVTTSYISPKMKALGPSAVEAGVVILNEIGVDPGIDHMSAMKIIDDVRNRQGAITSFKSFCGGLPAPQCNDNPLGYKFSWSPRAVLTAGKNAARFREEGKEVHVPGPELFDFHQPLHVEGVGALEGYPNRDSLIYEEPYGLQTAETLFRGTLRYPGWCETLKRVVELGLLDETPNAWVAGTTFREYIASLVGCPPAREMRRCVAEYLELELSSPILDKFEWLGLFSDEPLPLTGVEVSRLDQLSALMLKKMPYKPGESDMIVLCHHFHAAFEDGHEEEITSTLIDYGVPEGDSSMARTVSLPAAVATRMILAGEIQEPGVHMPVSPAIYLPVLAELETLGIVCEERTKATL